MLRINKIKIELIVFFIILFNQKTWSQNSFEKVFTQAIYGYFVEEQRLVFKGGD